MKREASGDTTACQTLGLTWVVRPIKDAPVALRLLDTDGELVLDARETEAKARAEAEEPCARGGTRTVGMRGGSLIRA